MKEQHPIWETWNKPIKSGLFLGYMVLGFRDTPCDPNDFGIVYEADNPLILSKETAEELAQQVTLNGMAEYNEGFRAKIVILAFPHEVYFKG